MNLQMKTCNTCQTEKTKNDFYVNRRKCKKCFAVQKSERVNKQRSTVEGLIKSREYGRQRYSLKKELHTKKPTPQQRQKIKLAFKEKYPEKYKAAYRCNRIKKAAGEQLHHWSYKDEHHQDVIRLSVAQHYKAHRFLFYDQEHFLYRDREGNLLDTKKKHEEYINKVL